MFFVLETSDKPKSRKDLITEMIARAKLARSERQQTREKTLDLTEQLDAKWKEMIGSKALVEQMLKEKHSNSTNQAEETSDYDKLVKELMFERKGVPSDKLKV